MRTRLPLIKGFHNMAALPRRPMPARQLRLDSLSERFNSRSQSLAAAASRDCRGIPRVTRFATASIVGSTPYTRERSSMVRPRHLNTTHRLTAAKSPGSIGLNSENTWVSWLFSWSIKTIPIPIIETATKHSTAPTRKEKRFRIDYSQLVPNVKLKKSWNVRWRLRPFGVSHDTWKCTSISPNHSSPQAGSAFAQSWSA